MAFLQSTVYVLYQLHILTSQWLSPCSTQRLSEAARAAGLLDNNRRLLDRSAGSKNDRSEMAVIGEAPCAVDLSR
jgi:hypothetical protein